MPTTLSTTTSVMGRPADGSVDPLTIHPEFGGFFRNKIINGDFSIWQRGDSFSTPGYDDFTSDRWCVIYDGTIGAFTVAKRSFITDDVSTAKAEGLPFEVPSYLRWEQTDAGSGSTYRRLVQRVENVRTLAGEKAVIGFWVRGDDSYTISVSLKQYFGFVGSSSVEYSGSLLPVTTDWTFFTTEIELTGLEGLTIDDNSQNYLDVRFDLPINVLMTLDFALVQIENEAFTSFERRHPAVELALARRYARGSDTLLSVNDLAYEMYAQPSVDGAGPYFYEAEIKEIL